MKEKNYPENLVGMTVIPTQQCDTCPDEQSACKKLILADGTHICLKATVPSGSQSGQIEAVDLGLPSGRKWANMNLGANTPNESGLYFAWGDTEWHEDGSDDTFYRSDYDDIPASKIDTDLPLEHDAAHAMLGGERQRVGASAGIWHMPTKEDFQELYDNCKRSWVDVKGKKGCLFTSKINGNSIFLPAAGFYYGASLYYSGSNGYYWSSSWYNSSYGYNLYFSSGDVSPQSSSHRYCGLSVRAVQDSTPSLTE